MASWAPSTAQELGEYFSDYLAAVDTVREVCGHNPEWSNAGEFIPEEEVYIPSWWTGSATPVVRQRSWLPKEEDDGA